MTTFNIGFVIFPNLTQLDFTGPLEVLHRLPECKIHIAAKSLDPVPSDCGLSLLPTTTFKDCCQLDLICVPGVVVVVGIMADRETVDFVRKQAIHHLGLHRCVCARGSRPAQRASSDDALGLRGPAAAGRCHLRERAHRERWERGYCWWRSVRHRLRTPHRHRDRWRRNCSSDPAQY
jgi:hypothetical protein